VELQGRLKELAMQGLGIAAISYDPVAVLADFSARRGITLPLLSDPGSRTIRDYGILNTTIAPTNQQAYGVPFPGTFMVNADGIVTARFFEPAYQERNTIASILVRLGSAIDMAGVRVSSPQLDVTTFVTDSTIAPGTHFSIVLDVEPGRGMHVYAPGTSGYVPVALAIEPMAWLQVGAARYPASETYHFTPLNEDVQVFRRRFRIVQELAVDAAPEAQAALKDVASMTLNGTLRYQACDDRICFSPQSVPLTWTVNLRQLDRDRARR
jgi:AhpC/TSA family protein/cytochrome c biogenesis DsbD-like protein